MKITMIIDTLGYRGGAERQFAGLAIALHRRGYDINVIAYHDHQGFQKEFDQEGVYYNVISHVTNRFQKILAIKKQIDLDKPEIVISYKSGANNIACILKMLGAKWKLIVSDRNTLQEITKTTSLQYNFFYKFADAIVPNSHSQMEFIKNNFPSLINKVHVITNFTDTEEFHPQDNHIGVESKTIIVVARICKQKNVLNFIETAKLLSFKWQNKAHIYWYGNPQEGEEEYVQECYNLIKKNKLHNFFEFKEATTKIAEVYRASDLFCLPSLWEGYPNALCEAMASGLPVSASRICDNEKIINDHYNGILFSPNNPNDIASKLDELLSLSKLERINYSQHARNFAVDNFSLNLFTDKYVRLINSLI